MQKRQRKQSFYPKIEDLSEQDHAVLEPSTAVARACVYCEKVFRSRSSLLAHKIKCTKNQSYLKNRFKKILPEIGSPPPPQIQAQPVQYQFTLCPPRPNNILLIPNGTLSTLNSIIDQILMVKPKVKDTKTVCSSSLDDNTVTVTAPLLSPTATSMPTPSEDNTKTVLAPNPIIILQPETTKVNSDASSLSCLHCRPGTLELQCSNLNCVIKTGTFCSSSDGTVPFLGPIIQPTPSDSEDNTFDYECDEGDKDIDSKVKVENLTDIDLDLIVEPVRELEPSTAIAGTCVNCGKVFRFRSTFLAHKFKCAKNPNTNINNTKLRKIKIGTPAQIQAQRQRQPVLYQNQCTLCPSSNTPKLFKNWIQLKKHVRNYHYLKNSSYSCPHCKAKFIGETQLNQHLQRNNNKGTSYYCTYCNQKFSYKCLCKLHIDSCDKNPALLCLHCGKKFKNPTTVKLHIQKRHRPGLGLVSNPIPESLLTKIENLNEIDLDSIVQPERELKPSSSIPVAVAGSCVNCGKVFRFRSSLLAHKFKCTKNQSSSKNRGRGSSHIKTKPRQYFQCDQAPCTALFNTRNTLNVHRTVAHKNAQCTLCPKLFKNWTQLRNHVRKYHYLKSSTYSCPHCKAKFIGESQLNRHVRLNENEENPSYFCPHCNQEFSYKCLFKIHIDSCDKNPALLCPQCDKRFKNLNRTRRHLRQFHRPRPGRPGPKSKAKIPCEYCQANFNGSFALKRHLGLTLRKRSGTRTRTKLDCKHCGQEYLYPCQTRGHTRKQICAQCKLMFKCQVSYLAHISAGCQKQWVEGEYPCFICLKIFTIPTKLYKHLETCVNSKTKSNNFINICEIELCGRKFPNLKSLKKHHRHTHLFKFPCNHCGHEFSINSNLDRHLKKMLPEQVGQKFKCDLCKTVFESKCVFRKHEQMKKCGGSCVDHYDSDPAQTHPINSQSNAESLTLAENIQKPVLQKFIAVPVPVKPKPLLIPTTKSVAVPAPVTISKPLTKKVNPDSSTGLSCPHCQRTFTMEVSLQRHLNLNLRPSKLAFQCSNCGQNFAFRCQKSVHRCNNEDPLSSTQSEVSQQIESDPLSTTDTDSIIKIEPSTSALTPSQDEQDEDSGGPFHCWACGISFDRKIQFFNHVRTIHNEEPE